MGLMFFDGKCPECQLVDNNVEMLQNSIPFWECPECKLQILIENESALLLRHRGVGEFNFDSSRLNKDCFLEETDDNGWANRKLIENKKHLIDYIKNKIQKNEIYSYEKLIKRYVEYKYAKKSILEYIEQSRYYKIDFEDTSIEEILKERDEKNKQSFLYLHSRLYSFLISLLKKYYKNDNSWLPEMGMSKIEYYLSVKHFPHLELKKINSNSVFIKQSLKGLIVDLIKIIYLDEKILLSYDMDKFKIIENEIKKKD